MCLFLNQMLCIEGGYFKWEAMYHGKLCICFGDYIISKYLKSILYAVFHNRILHLTFSCATISVDLPPTPLLVSQKKKYFLLVTLSPFLRGALSYVT